MTSSGSTEVIESKERVVADDGEGEGDGRRDRREKEDDEEGAMDR